MTEKLLGVSLAAADDAALAKAARDGDADAFTELVKGCERTLYRVSRTILRSDSDCADAVQDALSKAWLHIRALREPRYFRTWLIRILLNECYLQCRRNKRGEEAYELGGGPAYQTENDELIDLRDALSMLPDNFRTVVTLYHVEDMSVDEIARVLNLPSGTVKSRLARARAKLSAALEQKEEAE